MVSDTDFMIAAARKLDLKDPAGAAAALARIGDLKGCAPTALPLWRATLLQDLRSRTGRKAFDKTAEQVLVRLESLMDGSQDGPLAEPLFEDWRRATEDAAASLLTLPVAQALLPMLSDLSGRNRSALIAATVGLEHPRLTLRLWEATLASDQGEPLEGWLAMTLLSAARSLAPDDPLGLLTRQLQQAGRADLVDLMLVLSEAIAQAPAARIRGSLAALKSDTQKRIVLDYLVRAPATPQQFLERAALVDEIGAALAPPYGGPNAAFLALTRALAQKDWARALELSEPLVAEPGLQSDVIGMRAKAQLRLGKLELAEANAAFLRDAPDLPWSDRSKAASLAWMARAQADGVQYARRQDLPQWRVGRPLVQSLWVGPRLRWIEQTALRSWLLNGWRVQLFVYDPPENVPDGVELMDASAIVPRDAVFREQATSGLHRGSLGAFSDRFRYALLLQRGGLWADTDIINLHRFEPEGARLVGSEQANVAHRTLNGNILAAPPGDPVLTLLHAQAEALVTQGQITFARIGPQLLCETFARQGAEGFTVLDTDVINPFTWCETRRYFDPADEVARDPRLRGAACLHVFTETWRLLGVDTDQPPGPDTFIGRAVTRIAEAPLPDPGGPEDAVRDLLGLGAPC